MATASASVNIKIDASAEGCTGMYWRTAPQMSATSNVSTWPRNGEIHKGKWETHAGERWVRFDNNFYLPEKQKGYTILTEVQ